jgi:hypothetical protein
MRGCVLTTMLLLLTAISLSCAVIPSRMVQPDDVIIPGSAIEGYLVIIDDVVAPQRVSASLCVDGDLNRCLRVGPQTTADGFRVHAVPPGNYCLTQLFLETGAMTHNMQLERRRYQCFVVEPYSVNYPGHLEVRTKPTPFSSTKIGFSFRRVDGVREQVVAQYPTLAHFAWETPTAYPIDPPPDD